jgi:hypothetical protein
MTIANYWLAAAFIAGFFCVGILYWQVAYSQVSLPDALYGFGLLAVSILAAAARAFGKARIARVILIAGAAVPAAVLARVVVEVAKRPDVAQSLATGNYYRNPGRPGLFVRGSAYRQPTVGLFQALAATAHRSREKKP